MSSLFLHSRNRTFKSNYNITIKGKYVTLSNLKLLLLSKIDIRKNRTKNLEEINTCEFLCLNLVKSMELVEETELSRRLSLYALPKIHLDRYG